MFYVLLVLLERKRPQINFHFKNFSVEKSPYFLNGQGALWLWDQEMFGNITWAI